MKKQTAVIGFLTMLCFLLVIWLPCQAADHNIYACKNNKTEKPRFVNSPTQCKKTEHLVTLTPEKVSNYIEFGSLNNGSVNVSSTWTKLNTTSTSHSFTKSQGDTTIEVHVNSRFEVGTFGSGTFGIKFQIRIDDDILPDFGNNGSIRTPDTAELQSIYAVFQGLAAGPHTVSLWASPNGGSSTSVGVDPGGWEGTIIVKEN
ncbi:MAG: hypothetical protein WC769_11105 [Thermodesulfovibrionales bacterium]|jgi:hypothetical protein